ncbi:DUF5980 family protein [Umezawaea sp. Da 62-37]|nr:DUF5980 family protein [Umezawaea sp. Da 62-37]WNV88977.1 DUF5980 family protein [Umezawaea sp. Da 62-37]
MQSDSGHLGTYPPAPVGVHTPEVWASDGTTTQAVPVTVKVQERC